jgi:hypothetical protein
LGGSLHPAPKKQRPTETKEPFCNATALFAAGNERFCSVEPLIIKDLRQVSLPERRLPRHRPVAKFNAVLNAIISFKTGRNGVISCPILTLFA